jgi:hypothetical protein
MVSVKKKVDCAVSMLPVLIMLILILLIIACAFIEAASLLFVCLCGMSESKAAYILEFVPILKLSSEL